MINITLSSKEDVQILKLKFQQASDAYGVRLGKSPEKAEKILAQMLGFKDFNTLLGVAVKPEEPSNKTSINPIGFVERIKCPSATYSALNVILSELRKAKGVHSVIFAVRDGKLNESATTLLLVADSGTKLFDTSLLTVERPPREMEVLDIFSVLKELKLLNKTSYTSERVPSTSNMPSNEAAKLLTTFSMVSVFPDWLSFLATYNKSYKNYGNGVYRDDDWNSFID